MNKILNLSLVPLAATAAVASATIFSAPAQAASFAGILNISGGSTFDDGGDGLGGDNDSLTIVDGTVVVTSSGFFSSWAGDTITNVPIVATLADAVSNSFGTTGTLPVLQAYTATVAPNPITFSNGWSFTVDDPFDAAVLDFGPGGVFELGSFSGDFFDATDTFVGTGTFSSQAGGGSYTITVERVPEPLTILGTGLALGLGGVFKSKNSKKEAEV